MTVEENAAPAGDGETTHVRPESYTNDQAEQVLLSMDTDGDEPEVPVTKPSEEPKPEAEAEPADATVETEGEEIAAEPDPDAPEGEEEPGEEEQPPEPQPIDFESLTGETELRLRDGTVITVGDVKKKWGGLQELERAQQEFAAERQQFQQYAAQQAQQYSQFAPVAQQAIAALQSQLPEIPDWPDKALRESDPDQYNELLDDRYRAIEAHNATIAQIEQVEQQRVQLEHQAQAEQKANHEKYIQGQRETLFSKMPDLRDAAKRDEFGRAFMDLGQQYGFTPEELSGTHDARLMVLFRDLIESKKAKAVKPTPKKIVSKTPTATPGPVTSPSSAKEKQREQLFEQARNSGGITASQADLLLMEIE